MALEVYAATQWALTETFPWLAAYAPYNIYHQMIVADPTRKGR